MIIIVSIIIVSILLLCVIIYKKNSPVQSSLLKTTSSVRSFNDTSNLDMRVGDVYERRARFVNFSELADNMDKEKFFILSEGENIQNLSLNYIYNLPKNWPVTIYFNDIQIPVMTDDMGRIPMQSETSELFPIYELKYIVFKIGISLMNNNVPLSAEWKSLSDNNVPIGLYQIVNAVSFPRNFNLVVRNPYIGTTIVKLTISGGSVGVIF